VNDAEATKGGKARGIRDDEARDTGRMKRVRRDIAFVYVCTVQYGGGIEQEMNFLARVEIV